MSNDIEQTVTERGGMTADHEAHLNGIKERFAARVDVKYRHGQAQHGGNLWERPCMPEVINEVIDLDVYADTMEWQISTAICRLAQGKVDEAQNVLLYGNAEGRTQPDAECARRELCGKGRETKEATP